MPFQIGDDVELLSGGPDMVVVDVVDKEDRVYCNWFDDCGKLRRAAFPAVAVVESGICDECRSAAATAGAVQ